MKKRRHPVPEDDDFLDKPVVVRWYRGRACLYQPNPPEVLEELVPCLETRETLDKYLPERGHRKPTADEQEGDWGE